MAHLWQEEFGRSGRGGYHNLEWARKMEELGLIPTATGELGGKKTGNRMTHCVVEGGPFQIAAQEFLAHYHLAWQDMRREGIPHRKVSRKDVERVKRMKDEHVCPRCGQMAVAIDTSFLICGVCDLRMLNSEARNLLSNGKFI